MAQDEELEDAEAFADAYQKHRKDLFVRAVDFAEEADLGDALLSDLLLDLAIEFRTLAYVGEVEKPSASGLKLDLDRFQRLSAEMVRAYKKEADAIVTDLTSEVAATPEAGPPEDPSRE